MGHEQNRRLSAKCRTLRLVLEVALLASTAGFGADGPDNIGAVPIRDVLWQALPEGVHSVFVGSDDRLWLVLRHPSRAEDVDNVKRIIEREFRKEAPQLYGARPILFEATGRIWFLTYSRKAILGYDGERWIDSPKPKGRCFIGNCPNHGRTRRECAAQIAGSTLFFPDTLGVHTFDGSEWRYQRMFDKVHWQDHPFLRRDPDGVGVIAFRPRRSWVDVWRWREGAWTRWTLGNLRARDIAPGAGGFWVFMTDGRATFVSCEGVDVEQHCRRLFAELMQAETDADRDGVARKLRAYGPRIRHAVEDALSRSYDPKALQVLVDVLEQIVEPSGAGRFTDFVVERMSLLHYDDTSGRMFVHASGVLRGDKHLGEGLLMVNRDGAARFWPGKDMTDPWSLNRTEASGAITCSDGESVWLQGDLESQRPKCLDLLDGAFRHAVPSPASDGSTR